MRKPERVIAIFCVLFAGLTGAFAQSADPDPAAVEFDLDGPESDGAQENASNPLAKANNTDIRWQYLDHVAGQGHVNDISIDGATMLTPKLKLKYELHYWETDVTGSSEKDWESVVLKAIYFPKQGELGDGVQYRVAVGMDLIFDFNNQDKGIGQDADQIGPFLGLALGFDTGTLLIPLVQHFVNYNGSDVNLTAFRVIALQALPEQTWLKLDLKVPVDWEHDNKVPASGELQFGKNINNHLALYADVLGGIGGDRPFDWGAGAGIRIKY